MILLITSSTIDVYVRQKLSMSYLILLDIILCLFLIISLWYCKINFLWLSLATFAINVIHLSFNMITFILVSLTPPRNAKHLQSALSNINIV